MKNAVKNLTNVEPGKIAGLLFNVVFAIFGIWYIVKTLYICINNL